MAAGVADGRPYGGVNGHVEGVRPALKEAAVTTTTPLEKHEGESVSSSAFPAPSLVVELPSHEGAWAAGG